MSDEFTYIEGMPIAELSGLGSIANEDQAELLSIANGSDFAGLDGLDGLGSAEQSEDIFEKGIYNMLIKTRTQVEKYPEIFVSIQNPEQLKEMLDSAIKYFHTEKRDQVMDKLAEIEDQLEQEGLINLQGIYENDGVDLELEDVEEDWMPVDGVPMGAVDAEDHYFDGENLYVERDGQVYMAGLGEVAGFFKKMRKGLKKFGRRVKKRANRVRKRVKKGLNRVKKAIVRYNPATLAIRGAFRAAIRLNTFQLANKLAYGFLSQAEANSQNIPASKYRKMVKARQKTFNAFKKLGGKSSKLMQAIKRGNKSGTKIDRVKPAALYSPGAQNRINRIAAQQRINRIKRAAAKRYTTSSGAAATKSGSGDITNQPKKAQRPKFRKTSATNRGNRNVRRAGGSVFRTTSAGAGAKRKGSGNYKKKLHRAGRSSKSLARRRTMLKRHGRLRKHIRGLEGNNNPAQNPETKAASGILSKIVGWFRGLFDKEARQKRKEERQTRREERKKESTETLVDEINEKKDTRGEELFNKVTDTVLDTGSQIIKHNMTQQPGLPAASQPEMVMQPAPVNPAGKGGGAVSWLKENKILAAGIGVAAIGAALFAIPASRKAILGESGKKEKKNKKNLSGIKLK